MLEEQIAGVRRFNRTLTQRIGVLNESFLERGRPLSEARLLYEIGHAGALATGAEVRELRARLGLDAGYLSRLLRTLERQGLITVGPAPDDGRVRRATLTALGEREVHELDRRSDGFAQAVLAPLSPQKRARLVAAMAEIERLTTPAAVAIEAEPIESLEARRCLEAYFEELARRFEAGFDPARSPTEAAAFSPPAGSFLIARLDGRPVGCAGLKLPGGGIGDLKRMWVAPSARGLGIGRRLLAVLEDRAREAGLAVLRLETNRTLLEAQALYRSSGYREVPPFNDEPYAHHWFAKSVSA